MKAGILCFAFWLSARALAAGIAPGGPGIPFSWATSTKEGVGTAFEDYQSPARSRVWFTIARGIVTEVFYPRVDTPQVRDNQLLITDGKSFMQQESDLIHEVKRLPGAPAFLVINRDPQGRYRIVKRIWTDPDSDTLIQEIRLERYVDGLRFFVLHKPAAAGSIFGDSATTKPLMAGEDEARFGAWQGVVASVPWLKQSVGYVGVNDGFQDLTDFKMDDEFDRAPNGNVALTGQLDIPATRGTSRFTEFLTFGATRDEAAAGLARTASLDVRASRRRFLAAWRGYLSGVQLPLPRFAPTARRRLAETALLTLKSSEDKIYPGAIVASPTHPWGEQQVENAGTTGNNPGYHVVWPRDLYHVAGAFMAVGDQATAVAILRRMAAVQFGPADGSWSFGPRSQAKNGSWPQNFWVDGTPVYGGYQADETSMPVLLAYRLWKQGWIAPAETWPMVKRAADFLAQMGPWTDGDRWEEIYGLSPNSAGYVIAAMEAASELAREEGDLASSTKWLASADSWALSPGRNLDSWSFTTTGGVGLGSYYVRMSGADCDRALGGAPIWTAPWNPDSSGWMSIGSIPGPDHFRKIPDVLDVSFLALVRLGVRSALNGLVTRTVTESDRVLRRQTPRGDGWYRYRFDGYGEKSQGRLWPILTGERIHYELEKRREQGDRAPGAALEPMLEGLESFASPEGVFSEQVWDEGPSAGQPTGSAAPLNWSHAEYLQLLWSLREGRVLEEIPSVRARYGF